MLPGPQTPVAGQECALPAPALVSRPSSPTPAISPYRKGKRLEPQVQGRPQRAELSRSASSSPKAGGKRTGSNGEESGSHVLTTAFDMNCSRATALEAVGAGIRKAVFQLPAIKKFKCLLDFNTLLIQREKKKTP